MEKTYLTQEEVLRNKSASTKLYAGLFVTFMNGTNSDLIKQIHAARKYSLNGMILFDYAHLNDYYIKALTESVFKKCKKEIVISEGSEFKQPYVVKFKTKEEKKSWKRKAKRK